MLCAQDLKDRVFQCVRCFYHADHADHTDLFVHHGYKRQLNEQATRRLKRGPRACDPRDPNDEHDSLPSPIHDFSDLETWIRRATALDTPYSPYTLQHATNTPSH